MTQKFHINPATGNVNKCNAKVKCRFGGDEVHFSSPEEARREVEFKLEAEHMDTEKTLDRAWMSVMKLTTDGDFDGAAYHLRNVSEWTASSWTPEERENLLRVTGIIEKLTEKQPTAKNFQEAEEAMARLHPEGGRRYQTSIYSSAVVNDHNRRDKNIIELAQEVYWKRRADVAVAPALAPRAEANSALLNPQDQINAGALASLNYYRTYKNPTVEEVQLAVDRVVAGEPYAPKMPESFDSTYTTARHDQMFRALRRDRKFYLAAAFPQKELKEALETAGVKDVSVTSFHNGREWGNAYTVDTPEGTRSFGVYEHRSTDSIIINGKTNWNPNEYEINGPYVADSSSIYFAEINAGEYQRAARTLAYFLKNAQRGTLAPDEKLAADSPRIDWVAKLSQDVPGFKEWHERRDVS